MLSFVPLSGSYISDATHGHVVGPCTKARNKHGSVDHLFALLESNSPIHIFEVIELLKFKASRIFPFFTEGAYINFVALCT